MSELLRHKLIDHFTEAKYVIRILSEQKQRLINLNIKRAQTTKCGNLERSRSKIPPLVRLKV